MMHIFHSFIIGACISYLFVSSSSFVMMSHVTVRHVDDADDNAVKLMHTFCI